MSYYFSSESVSAGHPDKICDQISDAILDETLKQDKYSRVAVETLVKDNKVILAGELSSSAKLDFDGIVRRVVNHIGYRDPKLGFCDSELELTNIISLQSADISRGVDKKNAKQGASDQGIIFGYATNETENQMPLAIELAHKFMHRQAALMKNGTLAWLRPDAKSQVTIRYKDQQAVEISDIVLSTQHDETISHQELKQEVIKNIILPLLPKNLKTDNIHYHINPTGNFVIGGPVGDCGLTGRKIIVDTYGGAARHGGGAFSGKDPSKVDRSAAYMARYIAKNMITSGLAYRFELQISYAIGEVEPVSILVNSFNTGKKSEKELEDIVRKNFDLTPGGIIKALDLLNCRYEPTAAYGHFGRKEFNWEKQDRVQELQNYL